MWPRAVLARDVQTARQHLLQTHTDRPGILLQQLTSWCPLLAVAADLGIAAAAVSVRCSIGLTFMTQPTELAC